MTTEDIAERFKRETALHEMTVLHDDGLYRHLRFRNPAYGAYWFDLITVPHALIFRGDGESFVFSRLEDMFEFFRSTDGLINPHYWAGKLTSDRDSVMRYDQDAFEQRVKEAFVSVVQSGDWPRGLGKAVREQILNNEEIGWEDGARRVLEEFRFYKNPDDEFDYRKQPDFEFEDTWEWHLRDYDWWFLWALHGIVRGIQMYDLHRAIPATVGGAA